MDFLDKVITVLVLYIFARFDKDRNRFDKRVMTACAYIGLSVIAAGQIIIGASSVGVQAAYNDRQSNINIEETDPSTKQ